MNGLAINSARATASCFAGIAREDLARELFMDRWIFRFLLKSHYDDRIRALRLRYPSVVFSKTSDRLIFGSPRFLFPNLGHHIAAA
jgi:hypothetical protein